MVKPFEGATRAILAIKYIQAATSNLPDAKDGVPTPGWELVDVAEVNRVLRSVTAYLRSRRPWAECPDCRARGETDVACICNGRGWLNVEGYAQWAKQSLESKSSTTGGIPRGWV